MKGLRIKVFTSGKLSGEGYLSLLKGGTVGREKDCTILSPPVKDSIKIRKTPTGKLSVTTARNRLKKISVEGVELDRKTLEYLGILKQRGKSEKLTLPFKGSMKISSEGFDLLISEEKIPTRLYQEELVPTHVPWRFRRLPFTGDIGFLAVLTASILIYSLVHLELLKLPPPKIDVRRDIPRRFTRFIYEPPVIEQREVTRPTREPKPEEQKEEEKKKEKVRKKKPAEKSGAKKPEKVARKSPSTADRNKIRERIASKGILGILTGRGKAGYTFGTDVLNMAEEVKNIDVQVASAAKLEKPEEEISLVKGDVGAIEEKSGVKGEKVLAKKVIKMETGAEMEISGGIQDKSRSAQVIQSVISSYLGGIKYVYNRELKDNPNLAGKVTVAFYIENDGTVSEVKIISSTLGWPPLEQKIVKRIKHWRFPPSKSGRVRVVFPFLFFPSM